MLILRRCGKSGGKWIRIQPFLDFPFSQRVRPRFVEDGYADDADVLGIVIFFRRVRFAHRAEAESRY